MCLDMKFYFMVAIYFVWSLHGISYIISLIIFFPQFSPFTLSEHTMS